MFLRPHQCVLVVVMLAMVSAARAAAPAETAETNRPAVIPEQSSEPAAGPQGSPSSDPDPDPSAGQPASSPDPPRQQQRQQSSRSPAESADQGERSEEGSQWVPPPRENKPLGPATDGGSAESKSESADSGSWMLRTLSALGVVIALIFMTRWAVQRMSGTPGAPGQAPGLVEVLARSSIAPRTQVWFLRINQRIIVAAHSSAGFQTLAELTDPEEVAWLLGRVESAKPASISRNFRQIMNRFDSDYRPDHTPADEGGDQHEHFFDRTRNELSGLLSRIRNLKKQDS